MDSEVGHSQVNENDEYQPHNGGSQPAHNGADHEKKSVLKKVKAKAKKIKDTIKKHGHQVLDYGRENSSSEDQNSPVGHDMDEDEKMAQDQQVDGAPVVDDSEDVKSVPPTFSQVENFVKRATPESEQVENLGVNSGGSTTVTGEEPHQEPRAVDTSPTSTETNPNIATELQGKTFGEGEMPGHSKVNLERPTVFYEDPRTQGSRPEAYTSPPSYQTAKTTDPTGTVDESEDAKSAPPPTFEQVKNFVKIAPPASEQVENLDELGVNYGDTTTVMGEEPHQKPRVVGASPTSTETNENITTELQGKTFGEGEKPGHSKVNLERPTGFDEDLRTQGSRPEAYTTPPSYQTTKATDPTGTVDESEDVKSAPPPTFEQVENFVKIATPASEQVENLDELGVNYGDTTAVMGEEPHQETPVVGASPTSTETNENIATELQGKTFGEEEKPGHSKGNLERPTGFDEVLCTQGSRPEAYTLYQTTKATNPTGTVDESEDAKTAPPPTFEQVENFVKIATPASEQVENLDELGVNHGDITTVMGEKPHQEPRVVGASPTSKTDENIATEPAKTFAGEEKQQPGEGEANLERPSGFDEDLHTQGRGPEAYTPANYQTKVNDLTETVNDEIEITPVEKSFERMNVQDEPKPIPEPKVLPDFSEAQYPPAESQDQFLPEPDLSSATKTQYPPAGSYDQNLSKLSSATETRYPSERNNDQFVSEISTATETQYPSVETQEKFTPDTITSSTNSNTENLEAIEQTFNSSTATVEDQPQYESVEKPSNENTYDENGVADEAVSAENAVASELGYDKKGVVGEAVSAKSVAASELGYDEKGDRDNKMKALEEEKSKDASNKSRSTLEYGKNIANSLTEKLAPVYGKVAEVGSAVKSKVSGTRTSDGVGAETENVGKEQNKGVSVKDYLAEKLKPSEEDKALSEVISETLYKRKEEPKKASEYEDRNVTKVDSDAIRKQEIEAEEHLGSGNGKSERMSEESNVNSPGKSVVGKIKGVVGSWFGKSDENQSSQVTGGEDLPKNKNTGVEVEQVGPAEGERRLQE